MFWFWRRRRYKSRDSALRMLAVNIIPRIARIAVETKTHPVFVHFVHFIALFILKIESGHF